MSARIRILVLAVAAPLVVACTALLGDFDSSEDSSPVSSSDAATLDSTFGDSTTVVESDARAIDGGAELSDATAGDAGDSGTTWTRIAYLTFDDGGIPSNWVQFDPRVAITDAACVSSPFSAVSTGRETRLPFGLFEGGIGAVRISAMIRIPEGGADHPTLRIGNLTGNVAIEPDALLSLGELGSAQWTSSDGLNKAAGRIPVTPNSFISAALEVHFLPDGGTYASANAGGIPIPEQRQLVVASPTDGSPPAPPTALYAQFGDVTGYQGVYYDDVIIEISPNP